METRDEWIEREARAARGRWHPNYAWEDTPEDLRQDWRNVVAPFYDLHARAGEARPVKVRFDVTAEEAWNTYLKSGESHEKPLVDWLFPFLAAHAVVDVPPGVPKIGSLMAAANLAEPTYPITSKQVAAIRDAVLAAVQPPVADADTLEKLAEVGLRAKEKVWGGPIKMNLKAEVAGVAAVLRAAKPRIDYEQIRVAFSECKSPKEWAEYINSRIRYRFEPPEPATVRAPVDIDGLAKAIREGWWGIKMGTEVYEDLRNAARAALAYLNIEPCAPPEYNPDDVALVNNRYDGPTIRTEGVRNPDDVALTPNERNELTNLRTECEKLRTRLAATAAKSARRRKALRQLNGAFAVMHATVSVAIDRRKQAKPREWTYADVEELANVMRREYRKDASSDIVEGRASAAALAALGWFDRKRGEA